MDLRISVDELLTILPDSTPLGEGVTHVTGLSSLEDATQSDLSFATSAKYATKLAETSAAIVLVPKGIPVKPRDNQVFIHVDDPSLAVAKICELIENRTRPLPEPGIHPSAIVDASATIDPTACICAGAIIGNNALVGPRSVVGQGTIIGPHVKIGGDCLLHPRVVVQDHCVLGNHVILQPGVVIGGDGFGYIQVGKLPDLYHHKVPQVGIVVLEDNVEIGANSTVDRARFGETRIGEGSKIDNLVQIGHNATVGKRCIICAQSVLAGSSEIGDFVVMWGQSAVTGHVKVGSFSEIGAQSGVAKSLPPQSKVTGSPARSFYEARRAEAALARLPELLRQVKELRAACGCNAPEGGER
jgi:UDP-3-O-[3-hydroxymyristoyl] glucosamine N-acyltransferase